MLRSLRRAMAQSMTLARDNVMECTVFDDADIEGWQQGGDYTVRLLRAIGAGCRAEPGLNAWFDGSTQGRRLFHHIQVGIAVDTRRRAARAGDPRRRFSRRRFDCAPKLIA